MLHSACWPTVGPRDTEQEKVINYDPLIHFLFGSVTSIVVRPASVLQVAEIQEAFKLFDSDSSGSIDYRELKVYLTWLPCALQCTNKILSYGFCRLPSKHLASQPRKQMYDQRWLSMTKKTLEK